MNDTKSDREKGADKPEPGPEQATHLDPVQPAKKAGDEKQDDKSADAKSRT